MAAYALHGRLLRRRARVAAAGSHRYERAGARGRGGKASARKGANETYCAATAVPGIRRNRATASSSEGRCRDGECIATAPATARECSGARAGETDTSSSASAGRPRWGNVAEYRAIRGAANERGRDAAGERPCGGDANLRPRIARHANSHEYQAPGTADRLTDRASRSAWVRADLSRPRRDRRSPHPLGREQPAERSGANGIVAHRGRESDLDPSGGPADRDVRRYGRSRLSTRDRAADAKREWPAIERGHTPAGRCRVSAWVRAEPLRSRAVSGQRCPDRWGPLPNARTRGVRDRVVDRRVFGSSAAKLDPRLARAQRRTHRWRGRAAAGGEADTETFASESTPRRRGTLRSCAAPVAVVESPASGDARDVSAAAAAAEPRLPRRGARKERTSRLRVGRGQIAGSRFRRDDARETDVEAACGLRYARWQLSGSEIRGANSLP